MVKYKKEKEGKTLFRFRYERCFSEMQKLNKKALIIMNPCAGIKKANRLLTDMISEIQKGGYVCTPIITSEKGEGEKRAFEMAKGYDLVVAVGGDGTFNEVVSGVVKAGTDIPIGYIPAGSTNDFAASLKLSLSPVKAAVDIAAGKKRKLDIGSFNGRCFTYVASFGAFTESAYSTPQELKNALGHLAYIIEGSKDIWNIKTYSLKVKTDKKTFNGDYIFGAISNSTSVGGLLKINPDVVDMNDGMLEILLIKKPSNLNEWGQLLNAITTMNYKDRMIDFCSSTKVEIISEGDFSWTLDGEKAEGAKTVEILNLKNKLDLIIP